MRISVSSPPLVVCLVMLMVSACSDGGGKKETVAPAPPVERNLQIEPPELDFGAEAGRMALTLQNTGTETLSWTVQANAEWVRVGPSSGDIEPLASSALVVEVRRSGLGSGQHTAVLLFEAGEESQSVSVTVQIPESVETGVLYLRPNMTLTAEALSGDRIFQKQLRQNAEEWTASGSLELTGTYYLLSIQCMAHTEAELALTLFIQQGSSEIEIGSSTVQIPASDAFLAQEAVFSGPVPDSLPSQGRMVLRAQTEGSLWVQMGPLPDKASFVRVPADLAQ